MTGLAEIREGVVESAIPFMGGARSVFEERKHPRGRGGKFSLKVGMHVQLHGQGAIGTVTKVGQGAHRVDFGRGPETYAESDLTLPRKKLAEAIDELVEFHGLFQEEEHPRGRAGKWVDSHLHVPGSQMSIHVTERPPAPSDGGYGSGRSQSPGFVQGDRVVLPDGRPGTVSSATHARGGEQHYLVHTEPGPVGSKAWKDETIFHEGKYVRRQAALDSVKKAAHERFKGLDSHDSAVKSAVDAFMGDFWNRDRPGRVESKEVPHSALRYSDEEMSARMDRAEGIAAKAEKIAGKKATVPPPFGRPVTLTQHLVPNEWQVEHGYSTVSNHSPFGGYSKTPVTRLNPGTDVDAMVFHYLTGRPAPANPKPGTPAWEQWTYGLGGVKGGTKRPGNAADRAKLIGKITQAVTARADGDIGLYEALLLEAFDLRLIVESGGSTYDPLCVEEASFSAIHFDPGLHPRGRKGEFTNVLARLAKHVEVNVPGGITVKRGRIGGFKVEGRGGSSFHADPEGAAQRVLAMHDNNEAPVSSRSLLGPGTMDRLGLFSPGGDRAEPNFGETAPGGMEGPFRYRSGWEGMYDPKQGLYYDHKSDVYMPRDFDPETGRNAVSSLLDQRRATRAAVMGEACDHVLDGFARAVSGV